MLNINEVAVPDSLFDGQKEFFEATPGFQIFGTRARIHNLAELLAFFDAEGAFLQEFTQKYFRQYQVGSTFVLVGNAIMLIRKAIEDNNVSHIVLARNHLLTSFDLTDMLLSGLAQKKAGDLNVMLHPTFTPDEGEMLYYAGVIFVLNTGLKLFGDEYSTQYMAAQQQTISLQAANE